MSNGWERESHVVRWLGVSLCETDGHELCETDGCL